MITPNPSTLPTPFNLRADLLARIADTNGKITFDFQKFLTNLGKVLESMYTVNVANFGASGNDTFDDTAAFQLAVNNVVASGGGSIYIPGGGTYSVSSVQTPLGNTPIRFFGDGATSLVKRRGTLAPGVGIFNVLGSNVSFEGFTIDGDTTVPVGLQYSSGFSTALNANDPMAPSLTTNTSIWIHGPSSNFYFNRMTFQHSAGYAILLDAFTGDINDVEVQSCIFKNNRPTLFGTSPGDLTYGSWNGGLYVNGDGRDATSGVLNGLNVTGCRWSRNTGNCTWQHLYGLVRLHSNIRHTNNSFEDCGLDGILIGGVTGGIVANNTFRRVGYITLTDTDTPVPKWLPNAQATALDSSGIVKGVPYCDNSFLDINGGCLDLDGHSDSVISGNIARVAYPGEPEYTEDSVAISGASGAGATSYGVNIGNTANTAIGGTNVSIIGNTFINLSAGAVRLYATRNCLVEANNIVAPVAPIAPPVAIGPGGVGVNQNATGNIVKHNRFQYNPGSPAPCVFEDDTVAPFSITDINYVFGNFPVIPATSPATEFQKDAASGSPVYAETVWF